MENEDVKAVKEDALEIQKDDIQDLSLTIANETSKSFHALAFIIIFLGFIFDDLQGVNVRSYSVPFMALFLAIILIVINTSARKIDFHTNVSTIFTSSYNISWEKYLDEKHHRLQDMYNKASLLLRDKVIYNRLIFYLVLIAIFSFIIIKI
ncbi:MAG: hypothetical protein WD000_08200 [Thermodesulfobacteriota bacterium]